MREDIYRETERQELVINELIKNGYELFEPKNYDDTVRNFKIQIEKHNRAILDKKGIKTLSDKEFKKLLNIVDSGNITARTNKLFKMHDFQLDDGTSIALELFNHKKWCKNEYQVAREIKNGYSQKGESRFDIIIYINGLPMISIELKQAIVPVQKAIDQIIRYKEKRQYIGLFNYIQIFFTSNFKETYYFVNNDEINRNFIFNWTDKNNSQMHDLIGGNNSLVDTLLGRCNISEMIARYIIPGVEGKPNIILRPYQVYAVKEILRKVKENSGNGYIFHTTGSGKTITSFKTCKLLTQMPEIDKVIFLVDRKDLDAQTKKAYENFEPGSYEGANNTRELKKKLLANDNKIVVATIQKMNNLVSEENSRLTIEEKEQLKAKRTVIVIDECHRSQHGQATSNMRKVFVPNLNTQYFGFTGTPITEENASIGNTVYSQTKDVFEDELHKYTIKEAIRDKNVLSFNIQSFVDDNYEKLNETRIKSVTSQIINTFDNYTYKRIFNSIFATSSKEQLKIYYKHFKEINESLDDEKKIKFTAIFSTNPDDIEDYADNDMEFVKEVIADFNNTFKTNESDKEIEAFKHKVQDFIKSKSLDIVLVVDMLLTGFDAPQVNTLYVDKPLKYHNLLQAYSRVNRLANQKNFGNIVTFIDQSEDREAALRLFSSGGVYTDFIIEDYEVVVERLNSKIDILQKTIGDIDNFTTNRLEEVSPDVLKKELEEVKAVLKDYEYARSHPDFEQKDIELSRQELTDLKARYRLIEKTISSDGDEVPDKLKEVAEEMDFEMHLFEEVRVDYYYLMKFMNENKEKTDEIIEMINAEDMKREKKEFLIKCAKNFKNENDLDAIEFIRREGEKEERMKHDSFIKENNIEDIKEKFNDITNEQKNGMLSDSDMKKYSMILNDSGTWSAPKGMSSIKAKSEFKKNAYNMVKETSETYTF